jgi:uncharacterized protein (TIRG00374 family)
MVVILGLSIWYVVANVDWEGLGRALLSMKAVWIVAGIAVTLGAHLARAQRWRVMIPNGRSISLLNAFSATIVGYLMNNVIPRSGELVRPYVLAKREDRTVSSLVATVLVERILDGLTLATLFVLLLFIESDRLDQVFTGYSSSSILTSLIVPIVVVVVAIVILLKTTIGEQGLALLERKLPDRFKGKLGGLLENFRAGIAFGGARGVAAILFWTFLIWLGYCLAVYYGFLAFGFDEAYGLGLADALIVLAITAVGITIAPTPGAFGVYHGFSKIATTTLFGIPADQAVAFALVTHAGPYLAVMVVGALFLLRENISFREVSRTSIAPSQIQQSEISREKTGSDPL